VALPTLRKRSPKALRRVNLQQVNNWISRFLEAVFRERKSEVRDIWFRWAAAGIPGPFICYSIGLYWLAPTSKQQQQWYEDTFQIKRIKKLSDELIPLLKALPEILVGSRNLPAMLETLSDVVSTIDENQAQNWSDGKTVANRALVWRFLAVKTKCGGTDSSIAAEIHSLVALGVKAEANRSADINDHSQDPDSLLRRVQRFRKEHPQDYDSIKKYIARCGIPADRELAAFVQLKSPIF